MAIHEEAKVKAEELCWAGIGDAVPILMEEGGIEEVLKFLAFLTQGEVVQAPVQLRLQKQAAKIRTAKIGTA